MEIGSAWIADQNPGLLVLVKRIRAIPKRLLCPQCGKGRLRSADADSDQIQLGEYERRCQMVCQNKKCRYSKSMLETFFAFEEDDEPSTDPQPPLFR